MQETNKIEEIQESNQPLSSNTLPVPPLRGSARMSMRAKQKFQVKSNAEITKINLLLELPFIKILPSYILQNICRLIKEQSFKNKEIILKQGEPINNLYIVK